MRKRQKSILALLVSLCILCTNVAYAEGISLSTGFPLTSDIQLDGLDISVGILYDDIYHENVLLKESELTLELTAHNTSSDIKMIQFFVGIYDVNEKMIEVALGDATIASGTVGTVSISRTVPQNAEKAIVYIWDNLNNTEPYIDFAMIPVVADHYGDTFITATTITDTNRKVMGAIDTAGDTDYIKFIPPNSGDYYFDCISSNEVKATLYNSAQVAQVSDATNFTVNLTAGQAYYLKIDKTSGTGDYSLVIGNFDHRINISAALGELYRIPVYRTSNSTSFRVSFDPEYFEIDSSYAAPPGVQVILSAEGFIEFSNPSNNNLVSTLPLRALKTGNTQAGIRILN
jgi:hypothetical protein